MGRGGSLVIVGGGVVGCATAYNLARMGWSDITVLEQGPLFETGGSTSHAPGLVFQTNPSRTMARFAKETVELYSSLHVNDQPCFYPVGSMEVACTGERLEDLKRRLGFAMGCGIEAELMGPDEAGSRLPLLDTHRIKGAYFVKRDGLAKPVRACEAMARDASSRGARFLGGTRVTGMDTSGGRVRAVLTDKGRIEADQVLLSAGIWGPSLGRMAGITVPLLPLEHLYARTEPLPELAGEKREVAHPVLRHQDRSMYFRQHADAYGIGSYLHEPLPVDPCSLGASATRPFAPQHFERGLAAAHELLPATNGKRLTHEFNGIFSFTPDGFPVLGESREVQGLWVAEAVWITHAGGVARVMAEWIIDGVPSLDLRECDINRFHPHALTPEYVRTRATQQYREVYDIIHPLQPFTSPRSLRFTPFHQRLVSLGAYLFESAGWERPQWFTSNEPLLRRHEIPRRKGWEARYWSPVQGAEHLETRRSVAMFDLTPFEKIEVEGPGALPYLQRLCANQIDRPVGKVVYTSMLNAKGGIVADLTVTRLGAERFMVVTGGAMGLHDMAWMTHHLPADESVRLTDVSARYACIGLWGPNAPAVLAEVCEDDLSNSGFPSFSARRITAGSIPVLALRVSYVGEAGWELYVETGHALALWDMLWAAGRGFGIAGAGGGAFDSLRLEKGYRLWGSDIHSEYNPFEAGLEFAVKLDKGEFLGRDALLAARDRGISRRLTRLYFDEEGRVVMGKEPILSDGKTVGYVTSSNFGYSLGKGIAYGYLPVDLANEGSPVDVYYFGALHPATVAREPG